MATKTQTIKIDRDRHGPTLRGGVNGRIFEIPTDSNYEATELLVEHLRNSGVSFETVDGAGSKEGSGDPAPNPAKPHMAAKSLDNSGGDQPGDVTDGPAGAPRPAADLSLVEEDARISDIRVAAERRTKDDASPAELAGEGEGGTPKVEANPFDHDGNGKPGGSRKRTSRSRTSRPARR